MQPRISAVGERTRQISDGVVGVDARSQQGYHAGAVRRVKAARPAGRSRDSNQSADHISAVESCSLEEGDDGAVMNGSLVQERADGDGSSRDAPQSDRSEGGVSSTDAVRYVIETAWYWYRYGMRLCYGIDRVIVRHRINLDRVFVEGLRHIQAGVAVGGAFAGRSELLLVGLSPGCRSPRERLCDDCRQKHRGNRNREHEP